MSITFDPDPVQGTTRAQWENAAEAWHRWGPTIESLARVGHRGHARRCRRHDRQPRARRRRGSGRPDAGRRAPGRPGRRGAGHRHLARDPGVRPAGRARRRAVQRRRPWSPTARTSRRSRKAPTTPRSRASGLIYFPDQQAALAGMCRALRPGGRRLGGRLLDAGPQRLLLDPCGHHPPAGRAAAARAGTAGPVQPGLPRRRRGALRQGRAYRHQGHRSAVTRPACAARAECVQFERESFGALHQMLSGVDEGEREDAWAEITEQLAQFEGPDGFEGPCEMLVVSGTR